MATPLHHPLKLNEAKLGVARPLFWVTTPLRHTPICVGVGWLVGGRILESLADQFTL